MTRVTLQLVVIKSIIFDQIHFCLCHIIQYSNIYQHTQDGLLKSNIVNNRPILHFSVKKITKCNASNAGIALTTVVDDAIRA